MLSTASKFGPAEKGRCFNLPVERTCCNDSGIATSICRAHCYTFKMVADRPAVWRFADANFAQVDRDDFSYQLIRQIRRAKVRDIRIHSMGDFYAEDYIESWIDIVSSCPHVRFVAYTRAWRIDALVPFLRRLAGLRNMNLWLSVDAETGQPPVIESTKSVWFAPHDGDEPTFPVDLVFRGTVERLIDITIRDDGRPQSTRSFTPLKKLGGVVVCPHENGIPDMPTDCVSCRLCMFKTK